MLGRVGVVSRDDAFKILNEHLVLPRFSSEEVIISQSLGRVLAEAIHSPDDLPEFDRSTMDGYAVRSSDTFGAAESRPAPIVVVDEVLMGTVPDRGIAKGEAMKISTGGALPMGADAVVMLEQTQPVDAASIEVVKPVAPLENVVRAGDDIKKGETILGPGHRIRPQDISALASVGIMRISVLRQPRVAIISTGNEIVPADSVPRPGQIRDSNSFNLEGLVLQAGAVPVKKGIIRDEYMLLRNALTSAANDSDMVLMTGGSSVGTADLTARVINDGGQPGVLVHGVALKPGKPLVIGIIGSSHGQVPVFGLPGHPAAVSVCYEVFVKSLIIRMTGEIMNPALAGVSSCHTVKARLVRSIASSPGREDHIRVALEQRDNGTWARPIFGASGLISTLVKAAGIVVIPLNDIGIEAGEEVEVRLF